MNEPKARETGTPHPLETSMRDLLAPLFRRRRVVLLTFSTVFLVTIVASFLFSRQYKASMEILVNRERVDPTVSSTTQALPQGFPVSEQEINSEVELLKSPDLLREVVLSNSLQDREATGILAFLGRRDNDWKIHLAVERLLAKLNIQTLLKTDMIQVSYKSADPETAYHVLNKMADLYMDKHLAVRRPKGSFAFFARETEKYKQDLANAQTRLKESGKEGGTVAPDVERAGMANQVVASEASLQAVRQSIAANQQRLTTAEVQIKSVPARSPAQEMTNSPSELLQQLEGNLVAIQVKKTQLLSKYQPDHPFVQEIDKELTQTQSAIAEAAGKRYVSQTTDRDATYELLRQDIVRTQSDLSSQRAQARALEVSIKGMRKQLEDLDEKMMKQADLMREVKANESNYLLYLSKREQERTSDALDEERIANVSLAVPATLPMSPDRKPLLILAVGFVLALFFSFAVAFIAEYLDPSFRTPAEVIEVLRIPVLATMPKQKT